MLTGAPLNSFFGFEIERVKLDARAPLGDKSSRLRFQPTVTLTPQDNRREVTLEPYGIELWFFKKQ